MYFAVSIHNGISLSGLFIPFLIPNYDMYFAVVSYNSGTILLLIYVFFSVVIHRHTVDTSDPRSDLFVSVVIHHHTVDTGDPLIDLFVSVVI